MDYRLVVEEHTPSSSVLLFNTTKIGFKLPDQTDGGKTALPGDSPLPSELGHQWSSGLPQLFELKQRCQSPQSHILRRPTAQLGQYSVASTNHG